MSGGRGVRGNREVSPLFLLSARGDLSGASAEAISKEGGSWGKHGFPHGSEPKARDAHAAPTADRCVSSRKLVEYWPLRNASLATISNAASRVVGTPRSSNSPSARRDRSIVESRSSSHTISLAIKES